MVTEQILVFRVDNRDYAALADQIIGVNGKTVLLYSNGVQAGIAVDEIIELVDKEQVNHKLNEKNKGRFHIWCLSDDDQLGNDGEEE